MKTFKSTHDILIMKETLDFLKKLQRTMDDDHFYKSELDGVVVAFETVILNNAIEKAEGNL